MATLHPQAPKARRRQRSARLTAAAGFIALSAFIVVLSVASGSQLLITMAAAFSVVLGAASARVTYAELMESRLEAARDRAAQAQAYREATVLRIEEQARYVTAMTIKLGHQEAAIKELEGELAIAHERVAESVRRLSQETRRAQQAQEDSVILVDRIAAAEQRAADAVVRMHELEQQLDVLRAELTLWKSRSVEESRIIRHA